MIFILKNTYLQQHIIAPKRKAGLLLNTFKTCSWPTVSQWGLGSYLQLITYIFIGPGVLFDKHLHISVIIVSRMWCILPVTLWTSTQFLWTSLSGPNQALNRHEDEGQTRPNVISFKIENVFVCWWPHLVIHQRSSSIYANYHKIPFGERDNSRLTWKQNIPDDTAVTLPNLAKSGSYKI